MYFLVLKYMDVFIFLKYIFNEQKNILVENIFA